MASSDAVVPDAFSTEFFGHDEVSHSIGYKEAEKTFKISLPVLDFGSCRTEGFSALG